MHQGEAMELGEVVQVAEEPQQLGMKRAKRHDEPPLQCPRCSSTNTKFCYYNNYSLLQPRHFCKTCKRYWTHGGTLRNIRPHGGSSSSRNKHVYRSNWNSTADLPTRLVTQPTPYYCLAAAQLWPNLLKTNLQSPILASTISNKYLLQNQLMARLPNNPAAIELPMQVPSAFHNHGNWQLLKTPVHRQLLNTRTCATSPMQKTEMAINSTVICTDAAVENYVANGSYSLEQQLPVFYSLPAPPSTYSKFN